MDVYIVLDGKKVVGVSARLQGAELIRADYERQHGIGGVAAVRIENHDVRDME